MDGVEAEMLKWGRDSRLQDPREEGETRSNEQDVRRERQYLETQDTSEELESKMKWQLKRRCFLILRLGSCSLESFKD
jgi:hypothetical protein